MKLIRCSTSTKAGLDRKTQGRSVFKKIKHQGFTLIELLVAMTLGALMMVLVMESYWLMMQTYFQMEASRELQREVRFSMNRLTDKIRANPLDYDAYDGTGACKTLNKDEASALCLTGDPVYENIRFYHDTSTAGSEMLYFEKIDNFGNKVAQPLLSTAKFRVKAISFRSSPENNPFDYNHPDFNTNQMQPKTTIFMEVESKREGNVSIAVQTTVSSRVYNPN